MSITAVLARPRRFTTHALVVGLAAATWSWAPANAASYAGAEGRPETLGTESADGHDQRLASPEPLAAPTPDPALLAGPSLEQAATWTAGSPTGGLLWSERLVTPPVVDGPTPDLTLRYDSHVADTRTPDGVNQASVVGEGFDLGSAYVERAYVPCADDGLGVTKRDLCWHSDNATLTLDGRTTDLVRISSSSWRLRADDGTRVRRLTGGSRLNPDNDRERWELTRPDGTRLLFGSSAVPGSRAGTGSVWTVPVVGDDAGEPCHARSYASSFCRQAWRWNLDQVIDPRNRAMSLWYAGETAYYSRNGRSAADASSRYTHGGYLRRVDYGYAVGAGATAARPSARVVLTYADRCLASAQACRTGRSAYWRDTPVDRVCRTGRRCAGRPEPVFFTRNRLTTVDTQVASGSGWSAVDRWRIEHRWVGGTADSVLWPETLTRVARARGAGVVGSSLTLPPTRFEPVSLETRRNTSGDGRSGLERPRLASVESPTRGGLTVSYSTPRCSGRATPSANTQLCRPYRWHAPGSRRITTDWLHAYVVAAISESDAGGISPDVVTAYRYGGAPAWAYTTDPAVPPSLRTWDDFRGYDSVTTTAGSGRTAHRSKQRFFRGLDGDRRSASGGTRSVRLGGSDRTTARDLRQWAGTVRESTLYASAASSVVMRSEVTTPWTSGARAGSGVRGAYLTGVARTWVRERAASASRGQRTRVVVTAHDRATGQVTSRSDTGDQARSGDESCEAYDHADATSASGAWRVGFVSRTVLSAGGCGSRPLSPPRSRLTSDTRTYFDGATSSGTAPRRGLVTRVDVSTPDGDGGLLTTTTRTGYTGAPTWLPETVTVPTAAGSRSDRTTYTLSRGRVTGTRVVRDHGGIALSTATTVDPLRGLPTLVTDPNGNGTATRYDALGRPVRVWLPRNGVPPGQGRPSTTLSYRVLTRGGSTVSTSTVTANGLADGTYAREVRYYDALGREKEIQVDNAVSSGDRVATVLVYDDQGRMVSRYGDLDASRPPGSGPVNASASSFPREQRLAYDGLGRPVSVTLRSYNRGLWSTRYTYGGLDTTTATPPRGGDATRTVTDVRGRVVSSVALGSSGSADDLTTTDSYDGHGHLVRRRTPTGTTTYDVLPSGLVRSVTDPDAGTTAYTYAADGAVRTTTDATGRVLVTDRDDLGRPTRLTERASDAGPEADTVLTEWTYDAAQGGKGLVRDTITYLDGKNDPSPATGQHTDAVVQRIDGYDAAGRVGARTTRLLVEQGGSLLTGLQPELREEVGYADDGSPEFYSFPQVKVAGGAVVLDGTGLSLDYNRTGQVVRASSGGGTVRTGSYDALGRPQSTFLRTGGASEVEVSHLYRAGTDRLTDRIVGTVESQQGQTNRAVASYSYQHDPAGNVTRVGETVDDDTQCFRRDAHARLVEAWTPASRDCASSATALGGASPYRQAWTYDTRGRTSTVRTETPEGAADARLTYDAARPGLVTGVARTTTVDGAATVTADAFTHDAGGRTSSVDRAGASQQLAWTPQGRLASVEDPDGLVRTFYREDGSELLRVSRQAASGATSTTLFVGATEVTYRDPDGAGDQPGTTTARRTIDLGDGLSLEAASGLSGHVVVVRDQVGDVLLAIGRDRATTFRHQTPYGAPRVLDPAATGSSADPATLTEGSDAGRAWPTSRGFRRGRHDAAIGLTSIRGRAYDPALGRYLAP